MSANKNCENFGEFVLYQTEDGETALDVRLDGDTVWLSLNQMAELFDRDKSVISRHLSNIFKSGELDREATVAKNATVQMEAGREVTRQVEYFNLDAILSVGYRVNSRRGTQFRIWATNTLKDHLIQGYSLNERRLREQGVGELEQAIQLLSRTLAQHEMVDEEGRGILDIISRYAKSWLLLQQYDEDRIGIPEKKQVSHAVLEYAQARQAIVALKEDLMAKLEATDLFGRECEEGLAGILGSIEQTFGGESLYSSIEEKAAHLLYFIIKDHPFSDGNKRIGSFLFILYLRANNYLADSSGIAKINDNALVALALLIAESEPRNKDLMIRLVMNLLVGEVV